MSNLSLAVAILDANLTGAAASFDAEGMAVVRSAWLEAREALARQAPPAQDLDGEWVLVPREPTEEMARAGQGRIPGGHGQAWTCAADAYRAMLSAAPPPLVERDGSSGAERAASVASDLTGAEAQHDAGEGEPVPHSVYLSAVAGRRAFRDAYRRCLPVVRAAEELAAKWGTQGQMVDSDDFYAAINAVFEAVAKRNSDTSAQEDRALAAVRDPSEASQDGSTQND